MLTKKYVASRFSPTEVIHADLIVAGGGLAGTCAAITAARAGIRVVLVQDRPVLGGNSSSEVRLWVLGATSHMGNNNRWAREGGVVNEILVENMYRNPEGNAIIFDTILLEKVIEERNIRLLLNTAVYQTVKRNEHEIDKIYAFCSQNSMRYELNGTWFCDASGDGIIAFQAGAAFRMGAEAKEEFGEKFAPDKEYGELLGHTIYFYSKDTGRPVKFVPPSYALQEIGQIPKYRSFKVGDDGCSLWWIEYGGRMDTVYDTEKIKWELWKVVYGVWNYIKNSGKFPEAENLTLEWVGTIPGKRESRRFEGEYMLKQQDIIEQKTFPDAIAFGGWSIDLHPADGVYSERSGCNQWHSKGIYQIPFRCFYSRNLSNLFFAGRIISASHVAFGSTRVMGTCAHGAQAVGMAAALAVRNDWSLAQLTTHESISILQQELLKVGHHIPGFRHHDHSNKVNIARISASSEYMLEELSADGPWLKLEFSSAQMIPVSSGRMPQVTLQLKATEDTLLSTELRISSKPDNYTPDIILDKKDVSLIAGENTITIDFNYQIDQPRYVFVCLMKHNQVEVRTSKQRVTGIMTVFNKMNNAVSNYGKQEPTGDIGVETFEFWCPHRRPGGHNFALKLSKPIPLFSSQNINNGIFRPTKGSNAWLAALNDMNASLFLCWEKPQNIKEIIIAFDTDYDHPMESSQLGHPETIMPFCVQNYHVYDEQGKLIFEMRNNHQTINKVQFKEPVVTKELVIKTQHPGNHVPAAIFEVQVY